MKNAVEKLLSLQCQSPSSSLLQSRTFNSKNIVEYTHTHTHTTITPGMIYSVGLRYWEH